MTSINQKDIYSAKIIKRIKEEIQPRLLKAIESGSYLEAITLSNLFINGVIITWLINVGQYNALLTKHAFIIDENIYNAISNMNEREIHRFLFIQGILSKDTYKLVSDFFNLRNEAMHRYILSEKEYSSLKSVLGKFSQVTHELQNDLETYMDKARKVKLT